MAEGDGLTYVERLDLGEQAHRHAMEEQGRKDAAKLAQQKTELREARQETWQIGVVAFFVAAVILGIVAAIYLGNTGPDDTAAVEERREAACVESGGGWLPERMLEESANVGLCVYPGTGAGA